jgi:PAS domain S-box-containing protein
MFLVAALSYLTSLLGDILIIRPEIIWPLWPGCVLLVAVLLLVPRKLWPFLIVAGLAGFITYNLRANLPLRSIGTLMLADTVEVLVAAYGLSYAFRGVPRLTSIKALLNYSLFAVVLAPLAGAFFGALGATGSYWLHWRTSFFSEALAFLTVMPAISSWFLELHHRTVRTTAQFLEATALYASLFLFGYFIFIALNGDVPPALLYTLLPLLLWAALRFASAGVTSSVLTVASLSIWGAIHGHGPFSGPSPVNNVLSLQLFLVVVSIPFLTLAVLVEERKLGESALRESEQRFRLVANSAPVMIWMAGPDMLRTYFNQPWLDFTGHSLQDQIGRGWVAGIHPGDVRAVLAVSEEALSRLGRFQRQYRLRCRDGEFRWVQDIGVPRYSPDGSFTGYIGSCSDITDRKLAEEAFSSMSHKLIEAQEAERTRIARELHDDINQRLALLSITLEQLNLNLPHSRQETHHRLTQIFDRLSQISHDIQSISHRLHSSKLDFLGLATASSSFCQELAEQQGVEIRFTQHAVPQSLSQENALCLFRVLQEALQNAVKHSGARQFLVDLHGLSDGVELTVSDTGCGFNPHSAVAGHGLGLISMQERMSLVNGHISIESQPGHGTTIRARTPLGTRKQFLAKGAD